MRNLLVPTDFSINAYKAFQYAVEISKRTKATITLMNACQLLESPFIERQSLRQDYNLRLIEELSGELEVWKSKMKKLAPDVAVIPKIYKGPVEKSIMGCSRDIKADLIVMGTQGASGIKEIVIGSTTARIIGRNEIPVLAVPVFREWKAPKNILHCSNNLQVSEQHMLSLFEIADFFSAQLHLATFTDINKVASSSYLEYEDTLSTYRENFPKAYKHTLKSAVQLVGDNFENSLNAYISDTQIDMLAIITHKHRWIDNLFRETTSRKMAHHTKIPLLALPD